MNTLQAIPIHNLMPTRLCSKKWSFLGSGQICTPELSTRSACTGDSGGGLVSESDDGRWVLLGVISYGSSCTQLLQNAKPRAQVYTSLLYYTAFIDRFTDALSSWITVV
ncbi:unnamed protein product [Anisakis simplex]|uniref:Peptidase S1 domain-containing protein n=1 Tax=Anisakis simplex TaxID=6269 RepID=A0A0M3JD82_ANISI|nr:unnamed protein product [Anisakis simplex]